MRNKIIILSGLACLALSFSRCSKKDTGGGETVPPVTVSPTLPTVAFNYNVPFAAHINNILPVTDNAPASNQITNDGATLGRVLFWDKHLSKNNTISCGSCHSPSTGWSDAARLSKGFEGGLTDR